MRKYVLIGLIGVIVGMLLSSTAVVLAGNLDSPAPPASTNSYTLEDVYDRLDTGAAGTQSTFTEPGSGPAAGTMHTLNQIMGLAPAVDDTNGATPAEVLAGKTYWGLRTGGTWGPQTGTMPNAPVPKTGQTTPSQAGDDGHLEKGVPWPSPRFTDNGDGTVTDNLTGLIWLKNANCANAQRIWSTALWDVESLNINGTMNGNDCGVTVLHTDWRLPNVRELYSLIDFGRPAPVPLPSGHPFTGAQSDFYWSSTTFTSGSGYAWGMDLDDGLVTVYGKGSTSYVWPVRGGQ